MSDTPKLCDAVYYYDEDGVCFAAQIAFVHEKNTKSGRPICNLAILKHDGRVAARVNVEPAYHDGAKWRFLNKWSWPDEIPA